MKSEVKLCTGIMWYKYIEVSEAEVAIPASYFGCTRSIKETLKIPVQLAFKSKTEFFKTGIHICTQTIADVTKEIMFNLY